MFWYYVVPGTMIAYVILMFAMIKIFDNIRSVV